jgi:gamma-glutamyltranspeptidase / glutathione hydrolase
MRRTVPPAHSRAAASRAAAPARSRSASAIRALRALPLLLLPILAGCGGGDGAATSSAAPMVQGGAGETVRTAGGMVSSASLIASEAGAEVLRQGGNAVDAAIATGLALAVTHPTAGNIGGGGFMVIRFPDGRATTFDFREKAPAAAHPEMFLGPDGEYSSTIHHDSHIAVGVPGTVAGFALAHERYGSGAWDRLVRPAVDLARDGFPVSANLSRSLEGVLPAMSAYPASVAAYSKGGTPYAEGDTLRLPELAAALERIEQEGRDGFYLGETARLIAEEMRANGGLITEEDLAAYEAVEREPVRGTYRGYEVISMPPPSSGGIAMVQILNILEGWDIGADGPLTTPTLHRMAEAMRIAFRDRALHIGDPDFVDVPVTRLTDKAYAATLREGIEPGRAGVSSPADVQLPAESDETTHYSVVDADGMAVSVTYTLEAGYGSKIVVTGGGFLLNNEMGDFNARPGLTTAEGLIGTDANLARPGKRMLSSMTPAILARDGELVAVFGSPGGRTIINTVTQIVLNLVDHGMTIGDAVETARVHHQWLPDRLNLEADAITPEVQAELEAFGHVIRMQGRQGAVHAIAIDPSTGERIGAADRRAPDGGSAGH